MAGRDAAGIAVFETTIGHCGVAWNERGIARVQLPGRSTADTRARLRRDFPGAPEHPPQPDVQRAVEGMAALLRGEPTDLADVRLDLDGLPEFHRRVYAIARAIPPGETLRYGDIAARLGQPGSARAVGRALGANPFPIIVPCHRVLAAGGGTGGFSATGGVVTKLRMLAIEGATDGGLPLFASPPVSSQAGAGTGSSPSAWPPARRRG